MADDACGLRTDPFARLDPQRFPDRRTGVVLGFNLKGLTNPHQSFQTSELNIITYFLDG